MQCSYAMLINTERQHATAMQTYHYRYVQSVLTVLSVHRVYMCFAELYSYEYVIQHLFFCKTVIHYAQWCSCMHSNLVG